MATTETCEKIMRNLLATKSALVVTLTLNLLFHSAIVLAEGPYRPSPMEEFVSNYYQHPDPSRLSEIYNWALNGGLIAETNNVGVIMGMFGGLLNQNPKFVPEFVKLGKSADLPETARINLTKSLWQCDSPACRDALKDNPFSVPATIFEATQSSTPRAIYETVIDHPGTIDILWGWFSVTGNTDAVVPIVNFAATHESQGTLAKQTKASSAEILTAGAARWSLLSQAVNHPQVMKALKECADTKKGCEPLLAEAEKKVNERMASVK